MEESHWSLLIEGGPWQEGRTHEKASQHESAAAGRRDCHHSICGGGFCAGGAFEDIGGPAAAGDWTADVDDRGTDNDDSGADNNNSRPDDHDTHTDHDDDRCANDDDHARPDHNDDHARPDHNDDHARPDHNDDHARPDHHDDHARPDHHDDHDGEPSCCEGLLQAGWMGQLRCLQEPR